MRKEREERIEIFCLQFAFIRIRYTGFVGDYVFGFLSCRNEFGIAKNTISWENCLNNHYLLDLLFMEFTSIYFFFTTFTFLIYVLYSVILRVCLLYVIICEITILQR
uniref:Uncharacterized protein n=1 Tax=Heterorhabditis bacteriophora TaxID=37862 RepID=A0A1I7WA07_HETBA